jgi:hypothetical protein
VEVGHLYQLRSQVNYTKSIVIVLIVSYLLDDRYYNLASLGKFDVVLVDPPWRIRGNEVTVEGRTMFTNSKFSLEYGTMSNEEVYRSSSFSSTSLYLLLFSFSDLVLLLKDS